MFKTITRKKRHANEFPSNIAILASYCKFNEKKMKQTLYNEHMRFVIAFNTKYLGHEMMKIEKMNVESDLKAIVQW